MTIVADQSISIAIEIRDDAKKLLRKHLDRQSIQIVSWQFLPVYLFLIRFGCNLSSTSRTIFPEVWGVRAQRRILFTSTVIRTKERKTRIITDYILLEYPWRNCKWSNQRRNRRECYQRVEEEITKNWKRNYRNTVSQWIHPVLLPRRGSFVRPTLQMIKLSMIYHKWFWLG